jgi:hypothetical protein
MADHLPQIGGFLASPVVGGIAGVVFMKEDCTTVPGGNLGATQLSPTEICSPSFNDEIGLILTLIGWAISGLWLAVTIWDESRTQAHTGLAPGPPPDKR